jgi:hypothetical protein
MPRLATIAGCGEMVCSTYDEITAAIDPAYSVAGDQPLSLHQAFATLADQAKRDAVVHHPAPEPGA